MNLKNKNNTVKVKASTGKKVGNRTVIGIVCILVAFAVCFGIIPLLNRSSAEHTRSGYTFLGWATSSSATSASYQPGGSYTANASVTLYAVWSCNHASTKTVWDTGCISLVMETVPVRQTVSKREKGLSVPDAAMLIKLAEVLDVPVSKLLGSEIETEEKSDTLAEQLSSINEQLAKKADAQKWHGK